MPRVLLLATTTGYQTRTFGDAAARLGVDLVFATDRCHVIDDPWGDAAIAIRFHDEAAAVRTIAAATRARPIDGVLAVGDRPTVIAAHVAASLGRPWHSPEGAATARNKRRTRECLRRAGLPVPWFETFDLDVDPLPQPPSYPCVIKPAALSGSRGVMRADTPEMLAASAARLRALVQSPDVRAERDAAHVEAVVETFIPGHEYAVEAVLDRGQLHLLAIFDKPDPLDGPFFEETIYLTPPDISDSVQAAITETVAAAAHALGLSHGPIHAECRVSARGVYVLEVAARPIGGLCARALRFIERADTSVGPYENREDPRGSRPGVGADQRVRPEISLEELLLRHALGESPSAWRREPCASGVMMIPIPRRGVYRGVAGIDQARHVAGVEEVQITAKADQLLVPLPEGASYLGFIFARGRRARDVDASLRAAHARLHFAIDSELPVRADRISRHG